MIRFEHTMSTEQSIPLIYHHDTVTPEYSWPNWHSNIEILYIRGGNGTVFCGSNTYDASTGDIFVINSNDIHGESSDSIMESTCFIIDNYFCITNGIPVETLEFSSPINSKEASSLCESLIVELENTGDFYSARVKSALLNLVLFLAQNYSQQSSDAKSSNENMRLALGYIKAHFNQNLSLDEIAYNSGLSKFYFSREFKKVIGMTPVTYINLLRCSEAKKLLKANNFSIKEVSEKCGFLNYSYFAKTFKKHIGVLPSEYRKTQNAVK